MKKPLFVLLIALTFLIPCVAAEPPFQIPLYRIHGNVFESNNENKVIGHWRFYAKLNSAGGWGKEDKWNWEARDWSFDLDFTIETDEGKLIHYQLRNFMYYGVGGWASWYGKGYGKRDAGPYEFEASGKVDVYQNGKLVAEDIYMDSSLVRTSLDEPGSFSIVIDYQPIIDISGGELRGEVTRFQVIDFQSLK